MDRISCGQIIDAAAIKFNESRLALTGPSRDRRLTDVRRVIISACLQQGHSMSAIGRAINRDHTSILTARKLMQESGSRLLGDIGDLTDTLLASARQMPVHGFHIIEGAQSSLHVERRYVQLANDNPAPRPVTRQPARKAPPKLSPEQAREVARNAPRDLCQLRAVRESTDRLVAALRAAHGNLEICNNGRGTA